MFHIRSISIAIALLVSSAPYTIDFGTAKDGADWRVIVDGVMGGLSTGKATFTKNSVVFTGSISLENNGGFSSYRMPFGEYDLSAYKKVEIRYRSAGGQFGIMLERYQRFYFPYHNKLLPDSEGEWKTLTFELADFDEIRLADKTGNKLAQEDLSKMIRIGFMKLDKKEGPFELEVDYLTFM
jgi:NADH dehydrogenase [ubiquinone] 1 alpha subcomplex assembly factor 1